MQKMFRSFIKNGKERKNVAFLWKERVPNPASCSLDPLFLWMDSGVILNFEQSMYYFWYKINLEFCTVNVLFLV